MSACAQWLEKTNAIAKSWKHIIFSCKSKRDWLIKASIFTLIKFYLLYWAIKYFFNNALNDEIDVQVFKFSGRGFQISGLLCLTDLCAMRSLGLFKWKSEERRVGYECMFVLKVKKSLKDVGSKSLEYLYIITAVCRVCISFNLRVFRLQTIGSVWDK